MDNPWSIIILALAITWGIQYALAYWQLKRFYRRVSELRRLGTVSVGKAGSAWRRRVYTVLVVDRDRIIQHVEQLSGWTVLANLKPLPGLEGHPMSDLFDDSLVLPVSPKQLLALRNAAEFIIQMDDKKKQKQKDTEVEDQESEENSMSAPSASIT
jgi:DNA-binding transcriptional regulator of glucitol operon